MTSEKMMPLHTGLWRVVIPDNFGDLAIADDLSDMKGGLMLFVEESGVGAPEEQKSGAVGPIVDGAHMQRRVAVHVLGIAIRSVVEQMVRVLPQTVLASLKSKIINFERPWVDLHAHNFHR